MALTASVDWRNDDLIEIVKHFTTVEKEKVR